MFTSKCLLLLAITFAPCQLVLQHVLKITGILLKDGNPVPFTSKTELENNESSRHVEDVCIKLRASVTSKTGVPYDTVGCIFCSLIAHPKQNHVIVNIENNGSAEMNNFVRDLYSVYEKRRYDTYIPGLNLRRHFEAVFGDWYAI
ncbi:unnamed protein product [Dicrocoelium dendriticum]|nr:unnamed protein product [Dicrocoelium dendriticum]